MIVKVQILMDDGETVVVEQIGDAFCALGEEFVPTQPIVQGVQILHGFCYLPVPPPRDAADVAETRRLLRNHFG